VACVENSIPILLCEGWGNHLSGTAHKVPCHFYDIDPNTNSAGVLLLRAQKVVKSGTGRLERAILQPQEWPLEGLEMNAAPITNTIIYLVGPPGVGKLTIGRILADTLNARLIHNHLWLNPVFSLLEPDGKTTLPEAVWPLVAEVRHAVFETAATLLPASQNLVFTHAAVTQSQRDEAIAEDILSVARKRGARLLVVLLTCSAEILSARVVSPERRPMLKEIDAEAARANASFPPFEVKHPSKFHLDTTRLEARDSAREVLKWVRGAAEIAVPSRD